ncbi:MAG: hypothetical protein J5594_01920 [Elusimicrobiaceae bacterium]|nr:hypothetical protein [Elusimicrobiaceae bacterium]
MIGLFLAVLLIILLILFVLRIIYNHTDFQTWLNILIVTVILFTVVLSIYIILSKVNTTNTPVKTQITKEESLDKKSKKPTAVKTQKDVSEMSDEELSIMIAEKYLTLKTDYEKQHNGEDGTDYAKQQIMKEYDLTEEEWNALYEKFVQNGYLDKAAQNLNLDINYLIKAK